MKTGNGICALNKYEIKKAKKTYSENWHLEANKDDNRQTKQHNANTDDIKQTKMT